MESVSVFSLRHAFDWLRRSLAQYTPRKASQAAALRRWTMELAEANAELEREVTGRRRVEKELRQAEAKYRSIFENAVEGIFQTTADGWYLSVNPALARIYGYKTPQELMANLTDVGGQLYVDASRRAEFVRLLHQNSTVSGFESQVRRRDGSVIWITETARQVCDGSGTLLYYEGTVEDITDRKHAEEELQKAKVIAESALEKLAQARQREIEIGARIQQMLLLGRPPRDVAGVRVAALTVPSQEIDGDFYDFFPHGDQCLDIVVGDVMGKGVPAALLGAAIKSALLRARGCLLAKSPSASFPEPEEIIRLVHTEVSQLFIRLGVFATLCYARLDPVQHCLTLVDCGHTKTVHCRRRTGVCETLQGENVPLGFSEKEIYSQVTVPLDVGDVVVFYSDGVTEAQNAVGEFFGVERLIEVIEVQHRLEPEQLVDTICRTVDAFSGMQTYADDLTCVAVTLEASGCESLLAQVRREVRSDPAELEVLRALIRTFCQELPVPVLDEASLMQLELAVTEAASNIMRHAYAGRTDQDIQMTAEAFPDRVVIQLSHRGKAFDPEAVRPPVFDGSREGGFGVYIITHSVDEVRYGPDEHKGNSICLVKRRPIHTKGEAYGTDV